MRVEEKYNQIIHHHQLIFNQKLTNSELLDQQDKSVGISSIKAGNGTVTKADTITVQRTEAVAGLDVGYSICIEWYYCWWI